MKAELLSVGTELLLGHIVDTNSAYLARRLAALGIACLHMSTVGDNLARATAAVRTSLDRCDLVVATGGLGPTEDDLTREAICAALGETPTVDASLAESLRGWFASRGMRMAERNLKQAWLIPSARALPNPNGTAPGWDVRAGAKRIIAMPGVPREMTPMWEDHVEPSLAGGATIRSRTLKLLGMGESAVEEVLGELVRSAAPTVATYAKNDGVHVRLTDHDPNDAAADARIADMERRVRERIGDHVWGADEDTLGGAIGGALRASGWRLATAESLSGGELARLLADELGSAYAGGVVLHAADAKALGEAASSLRGDVLALVPSGEASTQLAVRTPARELTSVIRFGSVVEGRRRAVLGALDLLRRALAEP